MYEEDFVLRLIALRAVKGVSAREMSLSIGQNPGYINNIECGKSLPSMSAFLCICDYLDITPKDFFDTESKNPEKLESILKDMKQLDNEHLETIAVLVKGL